MKQFCKTLQPLRWLALILLASTLFVACESKETKKMETTTEMERARKDSMPALDTDSNSTTRPETIKN
jgi:hypothetical protein